MRVAYVTERGDSDVPRFDGDPTCCAFHITSQDSLPVQLVMDQIS